MSLSEIDWGDAPAWAATVFAGAAAWFAYQTIKSQRQQIREQQAFIAEQSTNLRLERTALEAAQQERRSAQASLLDLPVETVGSDLLPRDRYGNRVGRDTFWATVHNRSREPVHQVTIRFGTTQRAVKYCVREVEGWLTTNWEEAATLPVLGGGRKVTFASPPLSEGALNTERPVAFFTDQGGVRWRLNEHGDLREATPEDESGSQ
ncbi:hypothetical protein [Streptomyces sp. LaPpAH-108]|uniref:hypothetical protein n=1 Tax=Streptomyces sp. LaPpAH-108 TaxID=1155714 RepID=UPI00131A3FB2|nr:hypothetical protein [Streptomyces sp. LaPpAH-108]